MEEDSLKKPNSCVICGEITPRMGFDLGTGLCYCEVHDPDLRRYRIQDALNKS